jgi:7tm Chemosensory receptor
MISQIMCLLHIYYIELLASFFQVVQLELEETVKFSEYSLYVKVDRSVISRRLEALKDIYGLLYQASDHVNAIFAWSQAFNFTHAFLQSVGDLYWIYQDFAINFPVLVYYFIPPLICLVLLLRAAGSCVTGSKSLTPLVYQIKCVDGEMALGGLVRILKGFGRLFLHLKFLDSSICKPTQPRANRLWQQ